MATARKLPSGSWRVQATKTVNGRKVKKSFTAETKKSAELTAIQWQNSVDRIGDGDMSLREACENYIAKRESSCSPVTVRTYQGYVRRYLSEYMEYNINSLAQNRLQDAFSDLAGKLQPKTLKSVYGFFRAVFNDCNIIININIPITIYFGRHIRKNNLPPCRFHDLRHSFASAMALLGIPEAYAMSIGGWENPETLHRIYEQTFTEEKQKFALKINDFFG